MREQAKAAAKLSASLLLERDKLLGYILKVEEGEIKIEERVLESVRFLCCESYAGDCYVLRKAGNICVTLCSSQLGSCLSFAHVIVSRRPIITKSLPFSP